MYLGHSVIANMAACPRMDELVKDYLLYRGLNSALKTLELELKNEKDKAFRVEKIVDQLTTYINTYDLPNLREYWSYLDQRIYARLEQVYASSVRKLEVSLFKFYLATAAQNNRSDKINEFFEKMTPELQNQSEWKDWFVFPFIKNPEENQAFAIFFTRQWQETFLISLHNFLSVIFQSMPVPVLLCYEEEQRRLTKLREENDNLRKQLTELMDNRGADINLQINSRPEDDWLGTSPARWGGSVTSVDLMDDFSVISQDNDVDGASLEAQPRTIRSFMRNLAHPSSPGSGRKTNVAVSSASSIHQPVPRQSSVPLLNKSDELKPSSSSSSLNAMKTKKVAIAPSGATAASSNGAQGQSKSSEDIRSKQETTSHTYPKMKTETVRQEVPSSFSQHSILAKEVTEVVPSDPGDLSPFILLSQEEYSEHRSSVTHCRFSCNGNAVATADVDGIVKVWGFQPTPVTMTTVMSKSTLLSVEWAPNSDRLILLGNKAGGIRLFDVKEKKTVKEATLEASCPRVTTLCSSPNGSCFVCGAAGKLKSSGTYGPENKSQSVRVGKLSIWDLSSMRMQKELGIDKSPVSVNCMAFNKTGNTLLTGASDGYLRLYDMKTYQCTARWQAHNGEIHTVHLGPDGETCFSLGSDNKFIKWNTHKPGTVASTLKIHQGACGPFILTGAGGYRQVQTAKGQLFCLDNNSDHILTCGPHGGILYKMNADTNNVVKALSLRGHRTPVTCVDWSSSLECSRCLTGSMDGKIRVSTLLPK